jgi:hypothetical protein
MKNNHSNQVQIRKSSRERKLPSNFRDFKLSYGAAVEQIEYALMVDTMILEDIMT